MLKQRTSGVVCEQHKMFYTKMKNKLGLMMAAIVIAGWFEVGVGQNGTGRTKLFARPPMAATPGPSGS